MLVAACSRAIRWSAVSRPMFLQISGFRWHVLLSRNANRRNAETFTFPHCSERESFVERVQEVSRTLQRTWWGPVSSFGLGAGC